MTNTVVVIAWLAISCGLQTMSPDLTRNELAPIQAANSAEITSPIANTQGDPGTADLQEQLESDLRARRPEEFAFIARVIYLMDNGLLSRDLIEGTFLWARTHQPRPFQYFERAMRIRAAQVGVQI